MQFSRRHFSFSRSNWFIAYGLVLHLVVAASVWPLAENGSVRVGLVSLIGISLYIFYKRYLANDAAQKLTEISCEKMGFWTLSFASGQSVTGLQLETSLVTGYLVVLGFKPKQGRRQYYWIWPDQLSATQFHMLRLMCLDSRLYPE